MITGRTSTASQPEALAVVMRQARLCHGDEVRADMKQVAVHSNGDTRFCNAHTFQVREVINFGDNGALPEDEVKVVGLQVETAGYYDFEDVIVSSNGCLTVTFDEHSTPRLTHAFAL